MAPDVTVITASYNHAPFIAQTIQSVLAQTLPSFQYLIWDDGSTDNSPELIRTFAQKDSRITYVTHEHHANKGLSATLHKALAMVTTPYVAFLESDDLYTPDFLETMLTVARQHAHADLLFCAVKPFGESDSSIAWHEKVLASRKAFIQKKHLDKAHLLFNYPISTFSCVLVKTQALSACSFATPIPQELDKFLWAQLLSQHPVVFVDATMTLWRKHSESFSVTAPSRPKIQTFAMLLEVLYPQTPDAYRTCYYALLQGKREKILREPLRFIIRLTLWWLFGKRGLHVTMSRPLRNVQEKYDG